MGCKGILSASVPLFVYPELQDRSNFPAMSSQVSHKTGGINTFTREKWTLWASRGKGESAQKYDILANIS